MKKTVFFPIAVIVLTALLLLGVTLGLNGLATENAQAQHLKLMQTLLPGSESFTIESYTGDDANIRSVHKGENGFVIETVTTGYADELTVLVGVSDQGYVTGLVVEKMHETASLGGNALTDWEFLSQFLKTEGDAQIGEGVDAISGATVTSNAIARCVNSAVAYVTGADVESSATP